MKNTDEHMTMSIKHPARTHPGSLPKLTLTITSSHVYCIS